MNWENIKFKNFEEFYSQKKIIRYYYKYLPIEQKWCYKRFVYGEDLYENETTRDCIWSFLNENENCNKELKKKFCSRRK